MPPERPPLRRPVQGRWLAGVAAGLAAHLALPVGALRALFVALSLAGGAGVVGYLLLWALVPAETAAGGGRRPGPAPPAAPTRRRAGPPPQPRPVAWAELSGGELWPQLAAGAALTAVGASLLADRAGWGVDPGSVIAVVVVLAGVALTWSRLDERERGRWLSTAGGDSRGGLARIGAGFVLTSAGLVLLVTGRVDATALSGAVMAAVAVLAGAAMLLAPWGLRFADDLRRERTARIRATERAEIAAHLHDSVLQTLALIQRRSTDAAEVARLARAQERELRAWLYQGGAPPARAVPQTLAEAVRGALAEVEDTHGVPVDVVAVGDVPLDDDVRAIVDAIREAVTNAVRHADPPVSVYVEAGPHEVAAYVRDHGPGLDLDDVPADRLGVRESILGRMARHGGSASVRPAPGGGTEVALSLASRSTAVGGTGADGAAPASAQQEPAEHEPAERQPAGRQPAEQQPAGREPVERAAWSRR